MFGDFLTNIATILGTNTTTAGIFMSLLLSLATVFLLLVASKGNKAEWVGIFSFLFATIMFTAMGWYPTWTGTVLAICVAVGGGYYLSKVGGGT